MNTAAELIQRFRETTNIPEIDEGTSTTLIEHYLTEAQRYWFQQFAIHCPQIVQVQEYMTTADNQTYSTSKDIIGGFEVYTGSQRIPLRQGPMWDYEGSDYFREGARSIRITGPTPRPFPGGLLARYVPDPGAINTLNPPTLQPVSARILIVYHAAYLWASRGGEYNPAPYLMLEERAAWGDPRIPGATGIITQLKQQTGVMGGVDGYTDAMWWRTADFR